MRNCLILGSGRSGTSLAAGVLGRAGYFMGERLYAADAANPKGYFEDPEINGINEDLLAQVLPRRPWGPVGDILFRSRLEYGQRWLAEIPVGTLIPCPEAIRVRIEAATARQPFCFKDPRFCYTLPAWRPSLPDSLFVCVFRHPGVTAASILTECRRAMYLRKLAITIERILRVWELMYTHVVDLHRAQGGEWMFMHYDQFFDAQALSKLAHALGASVDPAFADRALNRSAPLAEIPSHLLTLYRRLCGLAGYEEESWGS